MSDQNENNQNYAALLYQDNYIRKSRLERHLINTELDDGDFGKLLNRKHNS